MPIPVRMPQMGETVVEGTVSRWLKSPGEDVAKLEPLLEINTDKIDTEVPAPAEGTLLHVLVDEGQTVAAGTVLAYIGSPGEAIPQEDSPYKETESARPSAAPVSESQSSADREGGVHPEQKPAGREFISPVVARIAATHSVDLDQVPGSGMGGRITKKDIMAYVERQQDEGQQIAPTVVGEREPVTDKAVAVARSHAPGEDEVWQPLSTMRRIIAEHMSHSKHTSPHVTTVFEVDMTAVVRHREQHKAELASRGVRLTFTPYFVAAAAAALRAVPEVNARFVPGTDQQQSGVVLSRRIHIGVAVALEQGLIVPVVRDADERNLQGLARAVFDLAEKARTGRLAPDATRGGTFTITNHGVSGSLLGTPIINQPQAGILGIGAIVKRPIVRSAGSSLLPDADDAIVIRPMCYVSLTFDHRLLDGAVADRFVGVVKSRLEGWSAGDK